MVQRSKKQTVDVEGSVNHNIFDEMVCLGWTGLGWAAMPFKKKKSRPYDDKGKINVRFGVRKGKGVIPLGYLDQAAS